MVLTPAAELGDGLDVGRARVLVADRCGEEFQEMFAGFIAGGSDDCRDRKLRWPDGWDDFSSRLAHKLQKRVVEPESP
jgi:hypothetical protein